MLDVAARVIDSARRHWHRLLHRPGQHDAVIDGVRALAICWVFTLHAFVLHRNLFPAATRWLYDSFGLRWIGQGSLGVDLFFTISGYLIGTILFAEFKHARRINVRRFYLRRFMRLMPVYAVTMILARYMFHEGNSQHAWANVLYINNFLRGEDQYMDWCWSLAIEEQFYFVFPWFAMFLMHLRRGRIAMLLFLLALSGIIRLAIIRAQNFMPPFVWSSDPAARATQLAVRALRYDLEYDKPYTRYAGLLSGVIASYVTCFHREWLSRIFSRRTVVDGMCVGSIALMLVIMFVPLGDPFLAHVAPLGRQIWYSHFRDLFSMCAMFLILAAIHSTGRVALTMRAFLSWKGFYPIAQLSYSIYLVNELVLGWVFPSVATLMGARVWSSLLLAGGLGGLLVLAGAALLYVLIERPCMEMRASPLIMRLAEGGPSFAKAAE